MQGAGNKKKQKEKKTKGRKKEIIALLYVTLQQSLEEIGNQVSFPGSLPHSRQPERLLRPGLSHPRAPGGRRCPITAAAS